MTTIGWMNEEEKKMIQQCKARANVFKGMLSNLDWFQASILYKLDNESFRTRAITKKDYETLQEIHSLYRELVQLLFQDGSMMRAREINESLIWLISNYNVCRFLQFGGDSTSEDISLENNFKIQYCSSLVDVLLMGVKEQLSYNEYLELAKTYLDNLQICKKMKVENEIYENQQNNRMIHNPLDVLERHPEHVILYDTKTLLQVKMDILRKLEDSQYSLQDENLVLETIEGINCSLLRGRK